MFEANNYILIIFLLINCLFLNSCSDQNDFHENLVNSEKNVALEELKLRTYYNRLEDHKLSLGLLRQDSGGTDTPFNVEDIVEAFELLAFYSEYKIDKNQLSLNPETVELGKWTSEINIATRFGSSVSPEQKKKDLSEIKNLTTVISKLIDQKININNQKANMYIIIGNQTEVAELSLEISRTFPEFDPKQIPIISKLPQDIHCMAITSISSQVSSEIASALVIIRSELPTLMRRACFHEEITQSLGLTNDSHLVRPSIFNDDDEFATLTRLDKILLKILYDSRLYSGISRKESSEIIRKIVNEITVPLNDWQKN